MEEAFCGPPNKRIAVVTGGNKGIGLEVCRQLVIDGATVILTARDQTRGAVAVENLNGLGFSDVIFHQLDITDASSIASLADFLRNRFGKLDILVNLCFLVLLMRRQRCAYVLKEKFNGMDYGQRLKWMCKNVRATSDTAKEGVRTNYYGTKHVTEALLPLLQSPSDGRIVNVSSGYGLLRLISNEEAKQELNDIENLTEARLDELLDKFLKD